MHDELLNKTPDDFIRERKEAMRAALLVAVFAIPPEFLKRRTVLALDAEMMIFGRYHNADALRETHPRAVALEPGEKSTLKKLPYGIYTGADEIKIEKPFDRLALCAWQADAKEFNCAAAKVERRGARRLTGDQLAAELENSYLIELIGFEPNDEEKQRILEIEKMTLRPQ